MINSFSIFKYGKKFFKQNLIPFAVNKRFAYIMA